MTETPAQVPQSNALAEAQADSLGILFSRDPEGYSQQDLVAVIESLRAQRVKWAAAEAASPAKPKKVTKLTDVSTAKSEDLGL